MSFLIAVYVNEGIVLASDRRTTYNRTETINGSLVQKSGYIRPIPQRRLFSVLTAQEYLRVEMHLFWENH